MDFTEPMKDKVIKDLSGLLFAHFSSMAVSPGIYCTAY